MPEKIETLFNQYQQRYPMYSKEVIVDLMVNDGAITFETADKIKSGASLFILDKDWSKPFSDKSINPAEIFGASFSVKKEPTNFNRQIEPTIQSHEQGDCWMLSDINALILSEYGRKAIHDAIIPDLNGQGGVTIKFKNSPIEKKEFYISDDDIQKAKDSGWYSSGDDDMIAFELAMECIIKELVKTGKGQRIDDFDDIIGRKSYLTGVIVDEKLDKSLSISELLGFKVVDINFVSLINEMKDSENARDKIFHYIENNLNNNVTCRCNFFSYTDLTGRDKDDPIHSNHAYTIKSFKYGEEVIIIDPYGKTIPLTWHKFTSELANIYVSVKDKNAKNELYKALPRNYDSIQAKNKAQMLEECEKRHTEYMKEKARLDEELAEIERQHTEYIKEQELEQNKKKELKIKKALEIVTKAISKNDPDIIWNSGTFEIFDTDTIIPILEKFPKIVLWIDEMYYGWGNGTSKSSMLYHIIEPLADLANKKGLNYDTVIAPFKKNCYHEANALFYTNEEVIQQEVEKMVRLIKSQN